jgi:hypothetical protein
MNRDGRAVRPTISRSWLAPFQATVITPADEIPRWRSILLAYRGHQVDDQRIDFAQVFAPAFFWFQFAIANDNREIADLMQHFARHLFDRSIGPERSEADE